MPKILQVTGLGSKGLNSDLPSVDLDTGYITSGNNFRVSNGSIESIVGTSLLTSGAGSFNAAKLMSVKTSSAAFLMVMGKTAVKVFDGTTWSTITSAAGYASLGTDDELLWTSCLLGAIPIINNFQHVPEYWSPQNGATILKPLQFDAGNTWVAKSYKTKVIRAHGQYLFALNLKEGASELPDSFRWSHPADINGLPFTWDETDLSAIAGKSSVGGDTGAIVDGLTLRDSFIIYSEKGITSLSLSGDEFIWRKTTISNSNGLAAQDAIVEIGGRHYFLSSDADIMVNDGVNIQSIVHNKIRRAILDSVSWNYIDRSYAFKQLSTKEIWFCIPTNSSVLPNTAFVYNWVNDDWSIRSIPSGISHIAYANKPITELTYTTVTGTYSSTTLKYSDSSYVLETPLCVDKSNGNVYSIDDISAVNSPVDTAIERINYPLEGIEQAATILKIYPKFSGSGTVKISIGSHDFPGSPIRWQPSIDFIIGTNRKIEVRTTGILHAWKIESNTTNIWKFQGMDIEYELAGLR